MTPSGYHKEFQVVDSINLSLHHQRPSTEHTLIELPLIYLPNLTTETLANTILQN
jgi:hypothetical protein